MRDYLSWAVSRRPDAPAFWPRDLGYQSPVGRQITNFALRNAFWAYNYPP